MAYLFNNCARRDHVKLFGAGAFYDLDLTGRQANMARTIRPREICIVATPDHYGAIISFGWYEFDEERLLPDEKGVLVRVFFGTKSRSISMNRSMALQADPYQEFFNKLGHFKRISVIPQRTR